MISRCEWVQNFRAVIARNLMSLLVRLSLEFEEVYESLLPYGTFFALELVEEGLSMSMGLIVHELSLLIICAN